jgi:hypothetical protein
MLPSPHHFRQCVPPLLLQESNNVRHFFKHPTQNLGDSILNSSEFPLSRIMPNSPPPKKKNMLPSPHHSQQREPPLLL